MTGATDQQPSAQLQAWVDRLSAGGGVSAVVAGVREADRMAWATAGRQDPTDSASAAVDRATVFDLASLTKPFTATAALLLDDAGVLPLDTRLADLVSDLPVAARSQPLSALLRHRAGLIPWFPFYSDAAGADGSRFADRLAERFADRGLWQPPAESGIYSDLGPILWSQLAAEAGRPAAAVLAEVGLRVTYLPEHDRTAATRLSNGREVELAAALGVEVGKQTVTHRGIPQDGNARFLPAPGHAGLFADLASVFDLGQEWLRPRILPADAVDRALRTDDRYALGWWRADPGRDALPASAFGHNGFTGCSLWVEPERGRLMALLAHRLTRSDTLDRARREFHQLALNLQL